MPSLFERVGRSLTRKKPEIVISSKDSARTALEGFEQVSPNDVKGYVPTESKSPVTEKTPGVFQAFLRSKSPSRADPSRYDRAPHLSLHLPNLSEGGSSIKEKLSIVFEPAPDPTYTDEVIAAKRLTTSETLALVQKTASVITQRGLETPGIFKSFWYAQSPQTQRKLVVLFLQTLSVKAAPASDEPKPDPAVEAFEDQLKYASPHDVAELFKWAIRHFNLGAPSFGTSSDEYGWYKNFAESEQAAGYPPDAYTTILGPLLPPNHLELLNSIFNFASSVASYAEVNGVSGSRFSRAIGWWLLSERQPPTNGLVGFIHDWDTAARILEHLFLAYVRDQQRLGLMPKRLTQLVKSYPYTKQAAPTDQYFLPRPKFTTQQRTALFVRAAVPSHAKDHYNGKPLQLLRDALGASIDEGAGNAEYQSLWEEVKKHATEAVTQPNSPTSPVEGTTIAPIISISGVLTENAVRTLTNAGGESTVTSPIRPIDSLPESPLWRSVSPTRRTTDGGFSTTNSTALTSPVDWDEFTGQGFGGLSGGNNLTFSEFAPTPPRQSSTVGATARSTTSRKQQQRTNRRRSVDFKNPATNGHAVDAAFPSKDDSGIVSEATEGTLELDEAFIDNWAQILLDKTVASAWPSFALYELRNPLTSPSTGTTTETEVEAGPSPTQIQWLIIETYVNAPPTEASVPSSPTKGGKVKRSSSQRSDKRRPFGFFASSSSLPGKDVKDEKTAKRKDHVRRASEISTDSFGAKHKDPSKSQVDVSTQPAAIAEEPEPTTPIPPIAEEAAKDTTNAAPEEESAAKDATNATEAVSEADQEVPAPAPAVAATLTIPTTGTEGSRFVEGSSPGTIPEAVTDSGNHEQRDSKSVVTDTVAAIIGTAATAAAIKHEDADDVDVPAPVSEGQQHETAVMESTSNAPHVSDALAQHGEESVPVNETIESSVPPPVEASEQAALESQTSPDAVHSDVANEGEQLIERAQAEEAPAAALDAANHAEEEEREKARLAEEESARKEEEERAHQLELERISKEQELQRQAEAQRLQEEEAARIAEQERQRLLEEQAAAAEAQRLQAEAEELQRQQEEALRKAAEEKARQEELEAEIQRQKEAEEAARQKEEEDRLEQLRLEEIAKQEEARKAAEAQRLQEEEAARIAELERQRLIEEQAAAAEAQRLQAEAEELKRQEEEVLRKSAEEKARQEELEAELQRQKEAEEAAARQKEEEERLEKLRLEEIAKREEEERLEKQRLEEIARKEEEERLEKQRLEEIAKREEEERLEKLRLEEIARQEEEERKAAELKRLQEEEAARIAELEQQRLAAEQAAAAEAQRLQAEAEELKRQEEEALRKAAEEKARQEELEAELQRQREAEESARQKEEEERLEKLRLEEIAKREEEERKAAELQRLQEEEAARIAELEKQRLLEEQAAAAEAQRLQAEAEELKRQEEEALRKAAEEKARQEELEAELQRQKEAEEAAARQKEEEERLEKLRLEEIAKREEEERLEKQHLEEVARKEEEERLEKLRLEEIAKREEEERLEKQRLEEIAKKEEEERLEKQRLEEIAKREEEERLEKLRLEEIARKEEEERVEKLRLEEIARREEEERLEKQRLEEVARQEEEERKAAEQKHLQEEEEERVRLEKEKAEEEERVRKEEEERQRKEEEERLHQEELERKKVEEAKLAAEAAAAEQAHQDEPSDPVEAPPAHVLEHETTQPALEESQSTEAPPTHLVDAPEATVPEPESPQPVVEEPQTTEAPTASIPEEHAADSAKETVATDAPPVKDEDDSEEEILVHAVSHPNAEN